jgi:hypothetical protein
MLSRALYQVDGFLRFKNLDSKSYLEKIGNFFLNPVRQVFKGSEFHVISNKNNVFCYSFISNKSITPSLVKRGLFVFLLPFSLLGLLIKAIGLISPENRQPIKHWELPKKYHRIRRDDLTKSDTSTIDDLVNELEKRNLLRPLIEKHFENPENFLDYFGNGSEGQWYFTKFLNLNECACGNNSHNRLFSDMRFILQNKILEYVKTRSIKENKSISILSFGSGGGLQDFIILYLLIQMGVDNINLTLIDNDYTIFDKLAMSVWANKIKNRKMSDIIGNWEFKRNEVINGLSKLNKAYDGLKLNLKTYKKIDELLTESKMLLQEHKIIPAKNLKFDLVYGIDLDDYYKTDDGKPHNSKVDFDKSIEVLLKPNGFGLLSSHTTLVQFEFASKSKELVIKEQEVEKSKTPRLPLRLQKTF